MNRRSFLGASALMVGAATLFKGAVSFAKETVIKANEFFGNGDPTTVAQYCVDPKKDAKVCPERQKPERKDQYCNNCQFYTKVSDKGGKCALIPPKGEKKYVHSTAWCQTWVKKAGS